ncbi:TetR/AcrR family transcriptional regulator [[Mycobacterium] crassicus]|uniref:TetR/AcrR family transcriptional regulator n=1 Tax=[Mycobacterium] crassicus TaxID=2872309 RepID=A0ABU5XEV6_9MYCO|nr:TetR/AcrR family transcriptional regulator [Mycolicibacter sp. MYC098]MEB3020840.1 TetR/AcrR family transcriptional regulator [Mycolicibacter sp. MYC098]
MGTEGSAPVSRPSRSPGRLDRSRDPAILDAALQGVAEVGYDRLTMDHIAARAGVGKAAIYRRWPSKAVVVADAIAHWRRRQGPVEPPNTGSLRGDIEALVATAPEFDESGMDTMQVIVGVATAAMHNPVLAAALDDLVLDPPRHVVRVLLDHALARGEIPAGRDLSLIPDVALGLNVLRVMTGRPVDRVFVRRVLEDVILPLAGTAPTR